MVEQLTPAFARWSYLEPELPSRLESLPQLLRFLALCPTPPTRIRARRARCPQRSHGPSGAQDDVTALLIIEKMVNLTLLLPTIKT